MQRARLAVPILLAGTLATNVLLLLRTDGGPQPAPMGLSGDKDVAQSVSRAFREVSRRVTPAVVSVSTRGLRGSGVLISDEGLIVTNHHVTNGSRRARVELLDGSTFVGTVIGSDPDTDISLLHVDSKGLPFVSLSTDAPPEIGTWVLAVGNPLGYDHSVTFGIISAQGREAGLRDVVYEDFLQTDAAINAGNSGGPLIDLEGRIVGINTAKEVVSEGNQGLGFAIPAYLVREVVSELLEKGYVERGYFGIQLENDGVTVDVVSGTPARNAGIRKGDVLVAIAGEPVSTRKELFDTIARLRPGTRVAVDVLRRGAKELLLVEVGDRRDLNRVASD